ncbi:MAG TPA: hypothetical protein DCS93_03460 [Microscillaceae bacterium]|nr:hypothetical protein [Microscillaceae bacterium]
MKQTFTPIHFLHTLIFQGCCLIALLVLVNLSANAQTKAYRIEGRAGSIIHLTESSKYQETKRENGIGYYSAKIKFTVHHIEEGTQYRGFRLTNHQPPEALVFKFRAYNKQGTVFTQNDAYVKINDKNEYAYNISFKSTGVVEALQASSIKARYGTQRNNTNKKQLIDRYYQSVTNLNKHLQSLNYLSYDDPDRLKEAQDKLHDIHHNLDQIQNYRFAQNLNLAKNDPANFRNKLTRLQNRLNQADNKFHNAETKWHELYYQKFLSTRHPRYLDLAIAKNPHYAPPYVEKASLALKNSHPEEALHQLDLLDRNVQVTSSLIGSALRGVYQNIFDYYINLGNRQNFYRDKINYYRKAQDLCGRSRANIANCQGRTQRLIARARIQHYQNHLRKFDNLLQQANFSSAYQRLQQAESFQQQFGQQIPNRHGVLYQKLYDRIVQKSQSQVSGRNYQQALQELQLAENIANQQRQVNPTMAYRQVKTAAHSGIFDQNLQQTQQAVANGNFQNAAEILRSSRQYYQQNRQFMQNAGQKQQQLNTQYDQLIGQVIKRGQNANYQKNHAQALKQFKLANDLMGDVQTGLTNRTQYTHDIQLGLGQSYVGLAIAENGQKNYKASLEHIGLAESALFNINNASETAPLKKDIDFYKKDAIQKLVQLDINEAYAALKIDNLALAQGISQEIQGLVTKYRYPLDQDETMNRRYTILKKAIQDKECELNQKSYDQLVKQARSHFDAKKFIEGWDLLVQAIAKAQANAACGIQDQIAQQLKTRYKNAHQYALDWQKLRRLAGYGPQSQYDQAIQFFKQVAQNYQQFNLKIFGIEPPNLKAYISQTVNASFWAYGTVYFLKKQDHAFANELINKYINRVAHKDGIRKLAKEVAYTDFGLDSQRLQKNRCKTFLGTYDLPGERKVKRRVKWFKKAYCKRWNRLRREKS